MRPLDGHQVHMSDAIKPRMFEYDIRNERSIYVEGDVYRGENAEPRAGYVEL